MRICRGSIDNCFALLATWTIAYRLLTLESQIKPKQHRYQATTQRTCHEKLSVNPSSPHCTRPYLRHLIHFMFYPIKAPVEMIFKADQGIRNSTMTSSSPIEPVSNTASSCFNMRHEIHILPLIE